MNKNDTDSNVSYMEFQDRKEVFSSLSGLLEDNECLDIFFRRLARSEGVFSDISADDFAVFLLLSEPQAYIEREVPVIVSDDNQGKEAGNRR